jgi:hypothetical protein
MESGAARASTDFNKAGQNSILQQFAKTARPWLSPELTGYTPTRPLAS